MIVSHKYRFIYIKNKKVAGTSVEAFLSQFLGPDDVTTIGKDNAPPNRASFYNHMSLQELARLLPKETYESYYKFCIERHPVDKAVSHYFQIKARGIVHTPEEYVSRFRRFGSNFYRYSLGGDCAVDKVMRFEFLNRDLAHVCARLDIPFKGELTFRLKSNLRDRSVSADDLFDVGVQERIWRAHVLENNLLQWRPPHEVDPDGSLTQRATAKLLRREQRRRQADDHR